VKSQKAFKILRNFGQLVTLIANISEKEVDINISRFDIF